MDQLFQFFQKAFEYYANLFVQYLSFLTDMRDHLFQLFNFTDGFSFWTQQLYTLLPAWDYQYVIFQTTATLAMLDPYLRLIAPWIPLGEMAQLLAILFTVEGVLIGIRLYLFIKRLIPLLG